MNLSLANGPLVSLVAAVVLLVGVSGTGTTGVTSQNNDDDHSGLSTPSVADTRVLPDKTALAQPSVSPGGNEAARWRSDVMDSYESVPSLAALVKSGDTYGQLAPDAAERRVVLTTGISP